MLYLLLSILSSLFILVIFKISGKYNIKVIQPIIINYFVASALGYFISGLSPKEIMAVPTTWIWPGVLIASLYIFTFFLIGYSTRKAGMALTTIASKMSFVFPMFFSILIDPNDNYSNTKLILLIMAVVAVLLSVYKKRTKSIDSLFIIFLPFILFVLMGFADSLVKFAQNSFVKSENESSLFSFIIFSFAALWGIMLIFLQKDKKEILQPKVLITGLLLGIFNFGSLYFLINALNDLTFNNSLVFALNNMGVVLFSIIIALTFFKEKVTNLNKVGIALSIITFGVIMFFL
ncbi:MAG: hypothetical protein PHO12_08235 [Bacteroidales bacterium]|nr:hypothetical protein [Bacteroidales bacterium]MDD4685268.1 hypothetical protein [Bacteroidales bacterium]